MRNAYRPEDMLVGALADHGLDREGVPRLHHARRLVVPVCFRMDRFDAMR